MDHIEQTKKNKNLEKRKMTGSWKTGCKKGESTKLTDVARFSAPGSHFHPHSICAHFYLEVSQVTQS